MNFSRKTRLFAGAMATAATLALGAQSAGAQDAARPFASLSALASAAGSTPMHV